jgi:hypothetical protein
MRDRAPVLHDPPDQLHAAIDRQPGREGRRQPWRRCAWRRSPTGCEPSPAWQGSGRERPIRQLSGCEAGASSRSQAGARSGSQDSWRVTTGFHPIGTMEPAPPRGGLVPDDGRRNIAQTARDRRRAAGDRPGGGARPGRRCRSRCGDRARL